MIEIKAVVGLTIAELPELLAPDSQTAFAANDPERIFTNSEKIWLLHEGDVFIGLAGVIRLTFMGEPHLWFLRGKAFEAKHVRSMQFVNETLHELYGGGLVALVESGSVRYEKFAKHFGFKPVEFGEIFNKYRIQ